jgi:hypothetical protein
VAAARGGREEVVVVEDSDAKKVGKEPSDSPPVEEKAAPRLSRRDLTALHAGKGFGLFCAAPPAPSRDGDATTPT